MAGIVVAGGQQLYRAGLCALVEHELDIPVVASGLATSCVRAARERSDAVLVDEHALLSSGTGAAQADAPPFLAVTSHPDVQAIRQLYAHGARGIISSDASAAELQIALSIVRSGSVYLHPSLGTGAVVAQRGDSLSDSELSLVRAFALGHTNAEVARSSGVTERTIEGHRSRICAKLGVRTRVQLVRWALDAHVIGPGMPDALNQD